MFKDVNIIDFINFFDIWYVVMLENKDNNDNDNDVFVKISKIKKLYVTL